MPARLALLALAFLLPSCASTPRYALERPGLVLRANDPTLVRRWADDFAELRADVAALVPGSRADLEVEAWFIDEFVGNEGDALHWVGGNAEADRGRVHLLPDDDVAPVFAHELVHVLIDASWDGMPQMIEEGLADHVANELARSTPLERRLRRGATWRACRGGVARFTEESTGEALGEVSLAFDPPLSATELGTLDVKEVLERGADVDRFGAMYPLGQFVVARIFDRGGYDALRELSASAREATGSPLDPYLVAAELPIDLRAWPDDAFGGHDGLLEALADLALLEEEIEISRFRHLRGVGDEYELVEAESVVFTVDGVPGVLHLGSGGDVAGRRSAQANIGARIESMR